MKIKIFLTLILLLNSSYSQGGVISIEGSHTLTQESDMSLYQTIDKCLNLALANGIYEYLLTSNEYTEEEKRQLKELEEQTRINQAKIKKHELKIQEYEKQLKELDEQEKLEKKREKLKKWRAKQQKQG